MVRLLFLALALTFAVPAFAARPPDDTSRGPIISGPKNPQK